MIYPPEILDWTDLRKRSVTELQEGDRLIALGGVGTAWHTLPDGTVRGAGLQPVEGTTWKIAEIDPAAMLARLVNQEDTAIVLNIDIADPTRTVYRIEMT